MNEHLNSFITRIERLNEEMDALKADVKEVYAECKSSGFDVKIVRKIIALRKMPDHDRKEMEELLDTYMRALNME